MPLTSAVPNLPGVIPVPDLSLLPKFSSPDEFPQIVNKVNLSGRQIVLRGSLIIRKLNTLDVVNPVAAVTDGIGDLLGQKVVLQLVSTTIDPGTGSARLSQPGHLINWSMSAALLAKNEIKYRVDFTVDSEFGIPGAVIVRNNHLFEFFLVSLSVKLKNNMRVEFPCHSWIYKSGFNPTTLVVSSNRIFFSNQLYLPKDTPDALLPYREADLKARRGDGTGTRQPGDRIYDYDIYNDLGGLLQQSRPKLGGSKEFPYPRRCRTGRIKDIHGDEMSQLFNPQLLQIGQGLNILNYVPTDERYTSEKFANFSVTAVKAFGQMLIPLTEALARLDPTFNSFMEVYDLYDQGFDLSKLVLAPLQGIETPFDIINELSSDKNNKSLLRFPLPALLQFDRDAWRKDEEFARQLLAGTNPILIQCLQEFPPMSTLDPVKYGPQKSSITEGHIAHLLEGLTAQKAVQQKKLFIVDLHDLYMPYLEKFNSKKDIFVYATRVLLFLKGDNTLQPVAIELSTPNPRTRKVMVPPAEGETDWLWEFAKAHAAANDSGCHQLVSHWLRCHACTEPLIIAAHRHLSALHPLFAFLKPHMRYTLQINGLGRQVLIQAGGVAEQGFSTKEYGIEFSSYAYKHLWSFADEALPRDLLKRGMAVPDPGSKHGLKLVIEDYPYAADGLEIWSALEKWTREYVDLYYPDDVTIIEDSELQLWWNEVVNIGHGDKKDDPSWPKMDTKENLVFVLTTFVWVATAGHSAVNFSQYAYAGFVPNRPTVTRKPVPDRYSSEHRKMLRNPQDYLLSATSNKTETFLIMAAIEVLSGHAEDEEYIGQRTHNEMWTNDPRALEAFEGFSMTIEEAGRTIEARNADPTLKNRLGPVKIPYRALYPTSENGITGEGVPNSITI